MNCQSVRARFENTLQPHIDLSAATPDIREHLAACSDCRTFVESHRELDDGLALLRKSPPRFDMSLDTKVLANYRKQILQPQPLPRFASPRRRWLPVLCWSAAAAALALVAVLVVGHTRTRGEIVSKSQPTPVAVTPNMGKSTKADASPARDVAPKSALTMHKPTVKRAVRKLPAATPSIHPQPVETAREEPVPVAFRGLMYCDPLSCSGPMQMIRVQLPFPPAALMQGSPAPNGVVYADVVVGPDGIARGIRIVQ